MTKTRKVRNFDANRKRVHLVVMVAVVASSEETAVWRDLLIPIVPTTHTGVTDSSDTTLKQASIRSFIHSFMNTGTPQGYITSGLQPLNSLS